VPTGAGPGGLEAARSWAQNMDVDSRNGVAGQKYIKITQKYPIGGQ